MSRPDHVYSHNSSEAHQHDAGNILEAAPSLPYLPLSPQTREIRVLDLARGGWQEALSGNLRRVSLDARPKYEALSYTWGASIEGSSITINKHSSVAITDNLHRALKRLRGRLTKRTIWCDAICIHQADIQEREQQVSIMGDVYKQAMAVLLWLGEYPNASPQDQWLMRRPHWKRRGSSEVINSRGRRFAQAIDCAMRDSEPRWADRAWVVQEFVLSKETMLCFGPVSIAYDPVHIIDFLILFPEPLPYLRAFHEKSSDMVKLKYGIGAVRQSIAEAALYTSTASCSDERDKVYSLLSLIDETESGMIGPSYRRSCAETFAKATWASVIAQNSFQILELVRFHGSSIPELPTWAVDFTQPQVPSEGRIHLHFGIAGRSVVIPKHESQNRLTAQIRQDSKHIDMHGICIGAVTKCLDVLSAGPVHRGDQSVALATALAPFLEDLFIRHDSGQEIAAMQLQPVSQIQASLLLPYGARSSITTVLDAACIVWEDMVGPSKLHLQPTRTPFWDCSVEQWQERMPGSDLRYFLEYATFVSQGYITFATADVFLGVAPSSLEPADIIVLVDKSRFPMILRRQGDCYAFRGLAYVHGTMEGQLLKAWKGKDVPEVKVVLI